MKIQPKHLLVLNFKRIKYFSKAFHVCRLQTVEEWKRQTACYNRKLYFCPHQVTLREKTFFSVHFLSFFFVFWSTQMTTANLQGLTYLFEPFKKYEPGHPTQRKQKSSLLCVIGLGSLQHKSLTGAYFRSCTVFTKRKTRELNRSLPASSAYVILENQKLEVKKFISKIL